MYELANIFFLVFHSALIVFVLFGWMWNKTKKANLVFLLLIAFSWFVLGIWFGIGYCPLTDWHWEVLKKLGHRDLPSSYFSYLLKKITSIEISSKAADILTVVFFFLAFIASIFVNFIMRRKKSA
ncbi:MAG: DUF2784 family protein [Paludibacter sp.]|nr:DUF2784 family protein [Paludibacter sp.]